MKYILTENRMIDLIGMMVKQVFPKFNRDDCEISTNTTQDETYLEYYYTDEITKKGKTFARYYIWGKELVLNYELSKTLENYFGEENMTFIIDWFNKEFNQDAENTTV